jgi:hypothetical protein
MLPEMNEYSKAQDIAEIIQRVMMEEMRLEPPSHYWMVQDGQFQWLIAVMDVQHLHGSIAKYTTEVLRHQLSTAIGGLPVALSNSTGLRYGILLSGRPKLPKMVEFPGMPTDRDVIRFGVGLRGEVTLHAKKIVNMIVGGGQDSGKSTFLRMAAHTARLHGAKLYLADPMAHTFNPDVWNKLAATEVAGSKPDLLRLLGRMQAEVEERSVLFRQAAQGGIPPEDIDAYNSMQDEPMPRIWLMGDEMNTYLSDRAVQEQIADLARVGRKWGVHLILAGHNWRSEDIPRGLSAMFPTRLCLRVADDTSGRVTLDDHRWGRQAMKFRQPGRAVLRADTYQTVQLFRIMPAQELEWLAGTATASALTELEQRIVAFSISRGGEFKFREIAANVQGTSEWQVRKLAETWTERGWLEKGKDATSPRRIAAKLADLAGISLTGAQASQGITGVSQASQGLSQALTGLTGA